MNNQNPRGEMSTLSMVVIALVAILILSLGLCGLVGANMGGMNQTGSLMPILTFAGAIGFLLSLLGLFVAGIVALVRVIAGMSGSTPPASIAPPYQAPEPRSEARDEGDRR